MYQTKESKQEMNPVGVVKLDLLGIHFGGALLLVV
jgi:hypothetical protein